MCEYQHIPEYSNQTCEDLFDCCNCGDSDCGCRYCFSCNACEHCQEED